MDCEASDGFSIFSKGKHNADALHWKSLCPDPKRTLTDSLSQDLMRDRSRFYVTDTDDKKLTLTLHSSSQREGLRWRDAVWLLF